MSREKEYFNAFNLIDGIGPRRFKKLIDHFPSLEEAWLADEQTFRNAGLEEKVAETIIDQRKSIQPEKEYEKLLKERIEVLTIGEETYPPLLKEIYDAPAILYIRGQLKPEDRLTIGVVGSRKPSTYGQQVTTDISTDLARAGLTIVSGLALGTDTLAHRATLEAGQRTIAVLGSGLGQSDIYPSTNRQLANKIVEQGAVISEYPLGAPAQKQNFPARNRIISGLGLGTLVVEAAEKSGALITAYHALEQNREVFAIPGSIYNLNSVGTNNLIKAGARLVTSANDILEELNLLPTLLADKQSAVSPRDEKEAAILQVLSHEPLHIDKIIILTKLDTASISSALAIMELDGKIRNLGGMNYILAS